MENQEIKEPRDRILQASAHLFAIKGYSAIGVREIASAAEGSRRNRRTDEEINYLHEIKKVHRVIYLFKKKPAKWRQD